VSWRIAAGPDGVTFLWAARVIDAWLYLVRRARIAWRALPGDLMALLVIRACGIPRAGVAREVSLAGGSAVLIEHPAAALYLDHQWIPVHAQTLGRYVFARERLSDRIVAHEIEHVRQWQRLGPLFLPAYVASSGLALLRGRDPYLANGYEEAARAREGDRLDPPDRPD
jgi:hypothetical protein